MLDLYYQLNSFNQENMLLFSFFNVDKCAVSGFVVEIKTSVTRVLFEFIGCTN